MIYHRSKNRRTPSRRLDSGSVSVEDLPLANNHHTRNTRFNVLRQCADVHGEEGKIFIEENISYNEISLTTLNGGIVEFLLNLKSHPFKKSPVRGLYGHLG